MRIPANVLAIIPRIKQIRRYIHQHPEASFQEVGTAALVERELTEYGLKPQRIGCTGVVALLKGARPGKTVALRADMDALEMKEETQLPYASTNGCMHACGHDGHVAVLLGAAQLLSKMRGKLKGNVKFIFQPAEEHGGGGRQLCEAGVMDKPKVDGVFALHSWTTMPVGSVGTRIGPMMASTETLTMTVVGRGGHGAHPEGTVDPVLVSARIIDALQSVISRELRPGTPAVVTIGKIQGGTAFNIIPDNVELLGTIRTLNEYDRARTLSAVERLAKGIAAAHGGKCIVKFFEGYPPTINDPEMARLVLDVAARELGSSRSVVLEHPSMGGEDFSYYLQRAPGCFFRLGMSEGRIQCPPLHNSKFDFNDRALPTGIHMMVQVALNFLARRPAGR